MAGLVFKNLDTSLVHSKLTTSISNGMETEKNNAAKLQKFFQEIKMYAQKDPKTLSTLAKQSAEISMIKNILDTIQLRSKYRLNMSNFLRKRGGARFENETNRILDAVFYSVANLEKSFLPENGGLLDFRTGKKTGNVFAGEISKGFLKALAQHDQIQITDPYDHLMENKQIKMDIDASSNPFLKIIVREDASPRLIEIYNLLKDATFSNKNYDSYEMIDKEIFRPRQNNTFLDDLHMGNTVMTKAVYGPLRYLGFGTEESIKLAFKIANSKTGDNEYEHGYHLKSFYEITGAGLKSAGQYKLVKYILFNDPHGGIYVKSAREMALKLINANVPSNWKGSINIKKLSFTKQK